MAPCKSPVFVNNGGLYTLSVQALHHSLKAERHGVSLLLSSIFLYKKTHFIQIFSFTGRKNQLKGIFPVLMKYLNTLLMCLNVGWWCVVVVHSVPKNMAAGLSLYKTEKWMTYMNLNSVWLNLCQNHTLNSC